MPGFNKVAIYWSRQEIDHAKLRLVTLPLTGVEADDRLVIQDCIDTHKLKESILYSWNRVRPYRKTVEDFKKLLNNGVESLTDYLYEFFHLHRTIAHYDKLGWMSVYNTLPEVKQIVKTGTVPWWKADVKRIGDWLLSLI